MKKLLSLIILFSLGTGFASAQIDLEAGEISSSQFENWMANTFVFPNMVLNILEADLVAADSFSFTGTLDGEELWVTDPLTNLDLPTGEYNINLPGIEVPDIFGEVELCVTVNLEGGDANADNNTSCALFTVFHPDFSISLLTPDPSENIEVNSDVVWTFDITNNSEYDCIFFDYVPQQGGGLGSPTPFLLQFNIDEIFDTEFFTVFIAQDPNAPNLNLIEAGGTISIPMNDLGFTDFPQPPFTEGGEFEVCASITLVENSDPDTDNNTLCQNYTVTDNSVAVESISVEGENGVAVIDVMGASLQMVETVNPNNATDGSVDWSIDNTIIASIDANGVLTASADGVVEVTATAQDGSGVSGSTSITLSNQMGVGIEDQILSQISIAPNPTKGMININLPESINQYQINVYDMTGKLMLENNTTNIDLSKFDQGMYLVELLLNNGQDIITKKINKL